MLELATRRETGFKRHEQSFRQMSVGPSFESADHFSRDVLVADDVADGAASVALGGTMNRGDAIAMMESGVAIVINDGELAPADGWVAGDQRVDNFRRGLAALQQRETLRAEAVVRPVLRQHCSNSGFGECATRADVHAGRCHCGAEHAGSPAIADQGKSHPMFSVNLKLL